MDTTFISMSFRNHQEALEYFRKWSWKQPTIMAQSQKYGLWVVSRKDYQDLRDNHGFIWSKWRTSE
jgi:hypothetical protein